MKYILIFVVLCASSAFGQNAYGPDFLNLHCTNPDPNSNTVFGIPPKNGLVPNASANGNIIIYCDAPTGTLKASINGSTYNTLAGAGIITASTSGQVPISTGGGTNYAYLNVQFSPEGFISWNPGTLYPAVLSGTCVFAASTTCTVTYPTTWSSIPVVNITPVNPGGTTFTLTTSSTSQIIITASGSNSLTVNYTAVLPPGQNCNTILMPLPGARVNLDFVLPEWPSAFLSNLVGLMRVSSSDTVEIRVCNPTAATVAFSGALNWGAKLYR